MDPILNPSSQNTTQPVKSSGINVALIALAITFVLKIIMYNSDSINLLAAGIYLGIATPKNSRVNFVYFAIAVPLYLVMNWSSNTDPNVGRSLFTNVFTASILPLITLGIALIVRKIRKN